MPTMIAVTRMLTVEALLDIYDAAFAHQYGLGAWWAMYGDEQGRGPYSDSYLTGNIGRNLEAGRYDSISSPWFSSVGFYLGMVHGGTLDPTTRQLRSLETLVILTDPDFTNGYYAGREYYFFAASPEQRRLQDASLIATINSWALGYHLWERPEACLSHELGCMVGKLSAVLLPLRDRKQVVAEAVTHP